MFKKFPLLTALLAVALTAQASPPPPPVTIPSLPFTISAPGAYILATDFTFANSGTAIDILPGLTGPVVLDFKGHTITGPGFITAPGFNFQSTAITVEGINRYPITIQNGTLSNFEGGIRTAGGCNATGNVTIDSMIFNLPTKYGPFGSGGSGVSFDGAYNCSVKNCTFNAISTDSSGSSGIGDNDPQGGNSYANNTFNGVSAPFSITTDFDCGIDQFVLDNAKYSPLKKK